MSEETTVINLGPDMREEVRLLGSTAGLDTGASVALLRAGRLCVRAPGDRLSDDASGELPSGILLSGLLRQQRYRPDGRRQIVTLVLPGEVVLARRLQRRGHAVEAATRSRFLAVAPDVLERLFAREHSLVHAARGSVQAQLDRLRWLTWTLVELTDTDRICAFLGLAATMMPAQPGAKGGYIVTFTLSRSDIADLLCTTVEVLERALHALQREGAITILAPDRIEIPRPDALRRRATLPGCRGTAERV